MDPTPNGSTPSLSDIPSQIIVDLWRAAIAAVVSLLAWVGRRTFNRMTAVMEKLNDLESRLDRIEERSVTEFHRNSQMHMDLQQTVNDLRNALLSLHSNK
jgi:cell division protein FtsB